MEKTIREIIKDLMGFPKCDCPTCQQHFKEEIDQALSEIKSLLKAKMPKGKDEMEAYCKPGLSPTEADLLNHWDNGYNQALTEINKIIDTL